jgi:hypothetical protein
MGEMLEEILKGACGRKGLAKASPRNLPIIITISVNTWIFIGFGLESSSMFMKNNYVMLLRFWYASCF